LVEIICHMLCLLLAHLKFNAMLMSYIICSHCPEKQVSEFCGKFSGCAMVASLWPKSAFVTIFHCYIVMVFFSDEVLSITFYFYFQLIHFCWISRSLWESAEYYFTYWDFFYVSRWTALFTERSMKYCYARKQLLLSARLSHHNSCLSVCLSVTRVDQSETVQTRIAKFSLLAARKTLVSGTVKLFLKFKRGHPERECW